MEKIGHWLQVAANIGILAGLILVALQLQQNSDLARAALYSQHEDSYSSLQTSVQSEEFAETLAKSIKEPENLTDAEMLEMHGYLNASILQFARRIVLYEMGVFQSEPEKLITSEVGEVFGNRYAHAWWMENRSEGWHPELVRILDEAVLQAPGLQTRDQRKMDSIRSRLNQDETVN